MSTAWNYNCCHLSRSTSLWSTQLFGVKCCPRYKSISAHSHTSINTKVWSEIPANHAKSQKPPGPGVPAGYDTLRLQLLSPWVFQIPGGTAHRILKNSRSSSVQYLTKHCGTLSTFTCSLPEESLLLCWTLLKDGLFAQLYNLCGFHMRADADIHYSSSRPPGPDFAESWEELWIKLKHARPQQQGSHISGTPTVLKPQNLLPELWHTGLIEHGRMFLQDEDKSFIGLGVQVPLQNNGWTPSIFNSFRHIGWIPSRI